MSEEVTGLIQQYLTYIFLGIIAIFLYNYYAYQSMQQFWNWVTVLFYEYSGGETAVDNVCFER